MINRVVSFFKYLLVLVLFCLVLNVDATIKCASGKPGDTVNCTIKNAGAVGLIKKITVDSGLSFVGCDVCDESQYTIEANKEANFKFKISSDIKESKKLNVSFGGEDAKIEVVVDETLDVEEEESDVTFYAVTLVPGNGNPEKTLTCSVNSLNATCNVTLETLEDENFNGWGQKGCTEGATGSVKVNKTTTYYACYKKGTDTDVSTDTELNRELLLDTLVVKNGDEVIDLGFSIRIFEYSVIVPNSVTSLKIDATSSLEDVEIQVSGNEELDKEENVIKVLLTDKNNSINEYVLKVIKSDEKQVPLLSSLVVGGYNIGFDSKKLNYNLKIDSGITSLTVNAVPEKEEYEYEIVGQNDVKDGSQIKVVVKDLETDTSATYTINIEQDTSNLLIYIAIGGIVLVVLIILLIIVVKKGKKANNGGNNINKENKKDNSNKIKPTSNKANIPEVKPVIPTAPVGPVPVNNPTPKVTSEKKEDIEVLDF